MGVLKTEPVIHLQNVTKRFGSQVALDNVSLEVPPGVVCASAGRKRRRQNHRHPHPAGPNRSRCRQRDRARPR